MFKEGIGIRKVVLACGKTDLRRGIDGLVAIVRLHYGEDPLEEGTMFLFCGSRKDRLKGLIYEGDGYCLCVKRLSSGRFQWPRTPGEAMHLSIDQYRLLMDGFTVESSIRLPRRDSMT